MFSSMSWKGKEEGRNIDTSVAYFGAFKNQIDYYSFKEVLQVGSEGRSTFEWEEVFSAGEFFVGDSYMSELCLKLKNIH